MTPFRSGFAAVVGRPNVGKSTLVNAMVGEKVTITARAPHTTRGALRAVVNRPGAQLVLVDTPGLHRPRTALGARMNEAAAASLADLDAVVAVLDATAGIGPGDRMVLERAVRAAPGLVAVVVNKVDRARRAEVAARLAEAAGQVDEMVRASDGGPAPASTEYFPVSARTGEGVAELLSVLVDHLPEGPALFPEGMVRELSEASWVAELVREELLSRVEDELPHSIACRVTEWEWPRVRCEIVVERDSQKGIVIGRGGRLLKAVGTAVRARLPEGAFLELFVRVEPRWQRRDDALDRLGIGPGPEVAPG
ncbi:MAG TPA: GTPase Era [Acidimicrobiales bacterium]|nr:GTPase Era [Acidimicrobiales bacterium]